MKLTKKTNLPKLEIENSFRVDKTEKNAKLNLVKELLYNSLAQAIIKIFITRHTFLRIFLVLFVLILTSLAAFLVVQSILSYLSFEVITMSRKIFETPTDFPKITICNINMFTSRFSSDLIKDVNEKKLGLPSFFDPKQLKNFSKDRIDELFRVVDVSATAFVLDQNFSDISRQKLAHMFEDILINCQFNYQKCYARDFVWSFDKFYGNCFSFNAGFNSTGHRTELKKSSVAGWLFGLQLELYVNYNQNLSFFNDAKGLLLRVGNNSRSSGENLDGIRVSSGFRTDVAISRSFNYMLPQPYSNCQVDKNFENSNSNLYNLIVASPFQYTQKLCFHECFQQKVILECNCTVSVFLSLFENSSQCKTVKEIECAFQIFTNVYLSGNFIKETCIPLCPLECNSTEYKVLLSSNYIAGIRYANYITQNPNLLDDFDSSEIDSERARQSFVTLNIFYDSLSYELSTESPQIDLVSLLASIGGNLSLFLGVSVFSLCELIEVFIELYTGSKEKRKSKIGKCSSIT